MVVPSRIEVLCDAYVKVRFGILGDGFVDDVSPVALPIERAVFLPPWWSSFSSFPSVRLCCVLYYQSP